jgi:UrcA family protein
MNRLLTALPLAAAALLAAAPVLAQTADAAPGVVVRFGDLKLDLPGDAAILERRVERAAADVCGGLPDARDLDRQVAFKACRDEAMDRAVGQLRLAGVLPPARGGGISPLARR